MISQKLKRNLYILLVVLILGSIFIELIKNKYNVTKVDDYLYTVECDRYSYYFGELLAENEHETACSVVVKDGIIGRNFDWLYNEEAEFIVKTPHTEERYATIGLASTSGISNKTASRGDFSLYYYALPFLTVDGINEKGLFACLNMVPGEDLGITTSTNPDGEEMSTVVAVRYVLDYAADVDEAVELLKEKNLYTLYIDGEPFEIHLFLADRNKSVVVEFVDNELLVLENQNYMTNYYLSLGDYTAHSMGIERDNIIKEAYDSLNGVDDIKNLLSDLRFSRLYDLETEPAWYSEIYGYYYSDGGEEFTYFSDVKDFPDILAQEREGYEDRQRDGYFWQTSHSSIYDLHNLSLSVSCQESDTYYNFTLGYISDIVLQDENNHATAHLLIPLETISLLTLLLVLYGMVFENDSNDLVSRNFIIVILINIAALAADLMSWVYDGQIEHMLIQYISCYLAMIMSTVLAIPFLYYEYSYISSKQKIKSMIPRILAVFNVIAVIAMTVLTIYGKTFYFIDGVYFRGPYYEIIIVSAIINMIAIIAMVLKNGKIIGRHDVLAFLTYAFIPFFTTLYEFINPLLELGFVSASISTLFIYILLQAGRANELQLRQKILEEIVSTDQLTGLKSRRLYDEAIDKGSYDNNTGVLFCDANCLKYTNDYFGHEAGDKLLINFADFLKENFKEDDIYRISGDEFVVFVRNVTGFEFAEICEKFKNDNSNRGDIASAGWAYCQHGSILVSLKEAEQMMYYNKQDFYVRNPQYNMRGKNNEV